MLQLNGDQATITENVSGLAATFMGKPYPHVQHIHINGKGMCPTPDADTDGNGIVDTVEGQPAYGAVGTTLSMTGDTSAKAGTDVTIAPSGASFKYSRTITLDPASLASVKAGTAVIVVHGLDPAPLSKAAQDAKSKLAPTLPLAATSPAACGALVTSQMGTTPNGLLTPVAAARQASKTAACSRSVADYSSRPLASVTPDVDFTRRTDLTDVHAS